MISLLEGIKVIEQGTFITGPCAGMMLADLGADVIKVESPDRGDPYRSFKDGLYSAHFQAYNRNKRSIGLDLKTASDREIFYDLVKTADIYVQNFRPGAAARFGADYETLKEINPQLIYCSISGFGSDGPYADRPVYDSVAQAMSGFLSVAIDADQPRFLGPALADAITGIYASFGISGALIARSRTNKGQLIEISMLEAMAHFAVEPFMGYFALGELPKGADRPRLAQAFILRCRDERLVAVHLSSLDKFWDALVAAAGSPELATDKRFAARQLRIANYDELLASLNAVFATRDRDEWVSRFSSFDVPFAPVNSISDVVDDPQVAHLGMIVPVTQRREGARQTIRPPFRVDTNRETQVIAAPLVDQHGTAIRDAIRNNPGSWPLACDPLLEDS